MIDPKAHLAVAGCFPHILSQYLSWPILLLFQAWGSLDLQSPGGLWSKDSYRQTRNLGISQSHDLTLLSKPRMVIRALSVPKAFQPLCTQAEASPGYPGDKSWDSLGSDTLWLKRPHVSEVCIVFKSCRTEIPMSKIFPAFQSCMM